MTRIGIVVAVLVTATPAAANPHLERANEALDNLEYDEARKALDAALRSGANGPSELAEIHMLSGIVAASFGDATAARDAFRRLLAIDPQAVLGSGHAPKIVTPYEAAKRSLDESLLARYEPYAYGDEQIVIVVEEDPAQLVAGVRVIYRDVDGAAHRLSADGSDRIVISLPALPRGSVKIGIVDEHGNRLVVIAWDAPEGDPDPEPAPAAAVPAEVESDESAAASAMEVADEATPARKPLYERWSVWAGASVGLVVVGTYYGLQTRDDQRELNEILTNSDDYRYEDAVEVLDRGNGHAMVANVAFGAAVVTTAVSAYLYLRDRKAEAPSLTPVPVRGGAAVSWEVTF